MRTDGRTDMTKLRVAFRNFANAPKKRRTDSRRTALLFLQLDTTCKVYVHAPATLPPGKTLPVPVGLGPSAGLDTLQVEKIIFHFPGIEPQFLGSKFLNSATILTELPRLAFKKR